MCRHVRKRGRRENSLQGDKRDVSDDANATALAGLKVVLGMSRLERLQELYPEMNRCWKMERMSTCLPRRAADEQSCC